MDSGTCMMQVSEEDLLDIFPTNSWYMEVSENVSTPKSSKIRPILVLKPMVLGIHHFKNHSNSPPTQRWYKYMESSAKKHVHVNQFGFHEAIWLVVWNIFFCFHILGMSSSQLTFIFFRGVETTNQLSVLSLQSQDPAAEFHGSTTAGEMVKFAENRLCSWTVF